MDSCRGIATNHDSPVTFGERVSHRGDLRLLARPGRIYRHLLPRRIRRLIPLPLVILVVGSIGYPLIEGRDWTLFDGLYMTVITLTTVGYGEIPHPLSSGGRVFTMILALGGIFLLFYIGTEVIRSILTGELRELLGKEHMHDRLKHLHDHLIVCGHGRMGRIVCDELNRLGESYVVIDSTPPPSDWDAQHGIRLQGNATEDETLRKAGIERARALITVVGSDAENLYIALSAHLLNPRMTLIARAEDEGAEAKLKRIGVSKVISPYLIGGHRAVQAVLRPTVLRVLEGAARGAFGNLHAVEFRVEPGSRLAGVSLHESRLASDYSVTVVGILLPNGDAVNAPTGETIIEPESILVVFGTQDSIDRVKTLARKS